MDVAAHRRWQEGLRRRGEGHRAHELYREEYRRRPGSAAAAYLHGRLRADLDEQAMLFREAIRRDPGMSFGHHGLAVVRSRQDRPDEARRHYLRAVEAGPGILDHRLGLADLERREGRLEEARDAARGALAVDPGDPRIWSLLARIEEASGDGAAALARAWEAVVRSGGQRGHRAEWRRLVLALGSEATVRHALDRLPGAPGDSEHELARGLFLIRLGELEAGERWLVEASFDREHTLPVSAVRAWRRTLVRLGRYEEAFRVDPVRIQTGFGIGAGNLLAERFETARDRALAAEEAGSGEDDLVALADAFRAIGWIEEAGVVARRAAVTGRGTAVLGRTLAVREVVERLADAVDGGYRGRPGAPVDLDDLLARADDWFRRVGIVGTPSTAERRSYLFVGDLISGRIPGQSAFHDLLRENGLMLILGAPFGGPPEALLGEFVAEERGRRVTLLGRELEHDRLVAAHLRIGSSRILEERGDLSGVALDGFYVLNLDEISPGSTRTDPRASVASWRPSSPSDRICVDWPGGVMARLAMGFATLGARRHEVEKHEEGHLLDVARYLPVHSHLLRGLGLALRNGFSPREIQGDLEGNAQLVAMAETLSPRLALRTLIALGCARESAPPHSLGYHDALRELVSEIAGRTEDFPAIDPELNILQQLDRLSDEEIRALARVLLERRGLVYR